MLLASGYRLGNTKEQFLKDRSLDVFIADAKSYLADFGDKISFPSDLAFEADGARQEVAIEDLPAEQMFMDVGAGTIAAYAQTIAEAKTLFVNGPPGAYENELFEEGTRSLWNAIAASDGYSVIGGGDTVTAATKFVDLDRINYVCTAGGAMVRFLSGKKLPLIAAMEEAYDRDSS
jgi:phosphoglycerate kinase